MPDLGPPSGGPSHRARPDGWTEVLAGMEHDLRSVDGPISHAAHADWSLPPDLGDLPPELRSRAASVLGSQRRAIVVLEQRMLLAGRHLAALDSIPAGFASAKTAAYLDVTG